MAIMYDDEYHGARWRYGLQYRPVGAGTPHGWITFSDRPSDDPRCRSFGTIEYPRPLTPDEIEAFQLVDFGMVDDGASDEFPNLTAQLLAADD